MHFKDTCEERMSSSSRGKRAAHDFILGAQTQEESQGISDLGKAVTAMEEEQITESQEERQAEARRAQVSRRRKQALLGLSGPFH